MPKLTVAEAARRLSRSPEIVRRWLREGRLRGENFSGVWMVDERSVTSLLRNEPQRRYYKISWVRWPVGDHKALWHFQDRIPDQAFACGDRGPEADKDVEIVRGVMAGLTQPDGPACRTCITVARRMFSASPRTDRGR